MPLAAPVTAARRPAVVGLAEVVLIDRPRARCSAAQPSRYCSGSREGARTAPAARLCVSVPVVDLDVVRMGRAFAVLDERFQAQEKDAPLRAAVVHELDGLFPALVP